jgi:hypothetical protein
MTMPHSTHVRSSKYRTWLDPRAIVTRNQMRSLVAKDIASGTLRLAMHLSEEEAAFLEFHNPDTLGHADPVIHDAAWGAFIKHPDSAPYRVNRV